MTAGSSIDVVHRGLALAGGVLYLLAGFWVSVSGLVVPPWGVAVLAVVWLALGLWAVSRWRSRRLAPLLAFGAMAVFWVAFVLLGSLVFGFQA